MEPPKDTVHHHTPEEERAISVSVPGRDGRGDVPLKPPTVQSSMRMTTMR